MRTPQKVAMAVQAEEAELAELAETAEHTVAAAVAAAQIISITQGTPLLAELAANMVVTADEEH